MGIYIEKGLHIVQIMNDKGVEFDNIEIDCFCEAKWIKHKSFTPSVGKSWITLFPNLGSLRCMRICYRFSKSSVVENLGT